MTDALGRSVASLTSPVQRRWVLPQSAYRLLVDFLRCDAAWCNRVVPEFQAYGWVLLRRRMRSRRKAEQLAKTKVAAGGPITSADVLEALTHWRSLGVACPSFVLRHLSKPK